MPKANRLILIGGEGRIRTLNSPYPSATYKFYVAKDAKFATWSGALPGIARRNLDFVSSSEARTLDLPDSTTKCGKKLVAPSLGK